MQGLRCSRNRSLLGVNEDFENEHNAAVRLQAKKIVAIKDEMQGLRSSRNRSLLGVNEDFENERNAAVRLYSRYFKRGLDAQHYTNNA